MKLSHIFSFFGIMAGLLVAAYALARMDIHLRDFRNRQTMTTIDVHGTNPSAPIPIQTTLELHSDGTVTWRRPK